VSPVARQYRDPAAIDFQIDDLPGIPRPDRLLMVEPTYFDGPGLDRFATRHAWGRLADAWRSLGLAVDVIPGAPEAPDMVRCGHAALSVPPGLLAEEPAAIPSIMTRASRQAEVPGVERFLVDAGLHLEPLDPWSVPRMEGVGDGAWHPGRALLWAGVGPYSGAEAWERVAAWTGAPVVMLDLVDPDLPRLERCLAALDERTALYVPRAFTEAGVQMIQALFPRTVAVPAVAGRSPDGHTFVAPPGGAASSSARDLGLSVVEVDVSPRVFRDGSLGSLGLPYWSGEGHSRGAS